MKSRYAPYFYSLLLLAGCGGNNNSAMSPAAREFSVVMGAPFKDNSVIVDGTSYLLDYNEVIGPFRLLSADTLVTYNGTYTDDDVQVAIPAGDAKFIIFDVLYPNSGPPDFARRYPVRSVPLSPPSGIRLNAFGPQIPDALTNYLGPMDFYLLPEGQKPEGAVPFATTIELVDDVPFVNNFPAASGRWVIWTTRPGKPRNTLIKTVPFERKDRTSILLQSGPQSGAIYIARD